MSEFHAEITKPFALSFSFWLLSPPSPQSPRPCLPPLLLSDLLSRRLPQTSAQTTSVRGQHHASCPLTSHICPPPESPTGVSLVQSASISWPLHCPIKMQLHATHCRAHARCSPLLSNRALCFQDLKGQTLTRRVPVPIGKRMSCAEKNKIK